MKIKYERTLKNGKRHVLVELSKDESIFSVNDEAYYRLQYPMEEQVFAGHIIREPERVVWDTYEQKWLSYE